MTSAHGLTGSLTGFPVPVTVPLGIIPELTGLGVGVVSAVTALPFPIAQDSFKSQTVNEWGLRGHSGE